MEKKIRVLQTYVQEVNFNANDIPMEMPAESPERFDVKIEAAFNVNYTKLNDGPLYKVTYVAMVNALKNSTGESCFIAKVVYASLVNILDDTLDDDELERILKGGVAERMYSHLRVFVWDLLAKSQYPPYMLPERHLQEKATLQKLEGEESKRLIDSVSEQDDEDDKEDDGVDWECVENELSAFVENGAPLNYAWMQKLMKFLEEKFPLVRKLEFLPKHDDSVYKGTAMYKYYYRFFKPIDYCHPNIEGLDEEFWSMLFQLVFAECDKAVLVSKGGGLVDLQCTYGALGTHTISECTMRDLKKIVLELTISSVMKTGLSMTCMEIQPDILKYLRDDRLISETEFKALLGCDLDSALDEIVRTVEDYYARIVNCESQTFPYRFFDKGSFL